MNCRLTEWMRKQFFNCDIKRHKTQNCWFQKYSMIQYVYSMNLELQIRLWLSLFHFISMMVKQTKKHCFYIFHKNPTIYLYRESQYSISDRTTWLCIAPYLIVSIQCLKCLYRTVDRGQQSAAVTYSVQLITTTTTTTKNVNRKIGKAHSGYCVLLS